MIDAIPVPSAAARPAVHLLGGRFHRVAGVPRGVWLSAAGDVWVAYIFVHLLPELAAGQEVIATTLGEGGRFLERHAYLIALAGLAAFHAVERTTAEPGWGGRREWRGAGRG